MDETLEVNELDSVDGLFDDYVPEDTTDGAEETIEPTEESEPTEETAEPTETVEEVAEPVNPFELRVKFNGEERTLSEEEARTLAQKGMNYDRFYEPLERLARMNNMSVGDYVNQLNDTQFNYEVSKEMDTMREDPKYRDLDEEVLEEIATARVTQNIGERDRNYESQVKEQNDLKTEQARREIDKFMEEYPEFKTKSPDSLDPKVFEYVKNGYTLLEAYNKFLRENVNHSQTEAVQKQTKLNEANKKKALGNTTNAGSAEQDAFLSGFNTAE